MYALSQRLVIILNQVVIGFVRPLTFTALQFSNLVYKFIFMPLVLLL